MVYRKNVYFMEPTPWDSNMEIRENLEVHKWSVYV